MNKSPIRYVFRAGARVIRYSEDILNFQSYDTWKRTQHCWSTIPNIDVTCCLRFHTLLHVVACCWELLRALLKPVKMLAMCKRTQQLHVGSCQPTMLRPFARGFNRFGIFSRIVLACDIIWSFRIQFSCNKLLFELSVFVVVVRGSNSGLFSRNSLCCVNGWFCWITFRTISEL